MPKDPSQLLLVEENECEEKEIEEYAQVEELDEPDLLSQTILNIEIDENNKIYYRICAVVKFKIRLGCS